MAKGWDQPGKVELDAALRSMVREIGQAGAKAGMRTEAVDIKLNFSIEIEGDGAVRPVVHLGDSIPESEVHVVQVSLRPAHAAAPQEQSAKATEVDLAAAAEEAVARTRKASAPRRPKTASAKQKAKPAAQKPAPEPAQKPAPAAHPARPRLKLRKASPPPSKKRAPEKHKSQKKEEGGYRSEVHVDPMEGPVIKEFSSPQKKGPPPKDKPTEESPPPKLSSQYVIFDAQKKRRRHVAMEMLDTAEYQDDDIAGDTMISQIVPTDDDES